MDLPVATAAAIVIAATTIATAATATIAIAAGRRTLFARACFVYSQLTTLDILAVQSLDGSVGRGIFHLDECETAKTARVTIINHGQRFNSAKLGEHLADLVLSSLERQITYINLLGQLKLSLKTKFGPRAVSHHSGPDDNFTQYTPIYVEYKYPVARSTTAHLFLQCHPSNIAVVGTDI